MMLELEVDTPKTTEVRIGGNGRGGKRTKAAGSHAEKTAHNGAAEGIQLPLSSGQAEPLYTTPMITTAAPPPPSPRLVSLWLLLPAVEQVVRPSFPRGPGRRSSPARVLVVSRID
ncbi:hypothetical protein BRADI_2g50973v3 [Brachypodium distachyon]|uniref:Uncharacterized protein n=1 Tax=Brachypodium distachyon TaxID=15368 RepID=A0A0Q3JCE0_BRADI|nr:hypothetical protein BRADI_2g50973v3 [Brachypodium distachyon]